MGGARTADAVVIGGGISGAAVAFELSRAGMKVIVLEASSPGAGASSRSAGIIRTYHRLEAEAALALLSLATFRAWGEEVGGDCGYQPSGFLWIVAPEDIGALEKDVLAQRRLGATVSVISPDDVVALQPHFAGSDIGGAVWEPLSGFGEPMAATCSLHAAAARNGAELWQGIAVTSLRTMAGRITGVETATGSYSAPVVVLAAGAWSIPIAATAGVSLPVIATRMTTGLVRYQEFPKPTVTFIDTITDTFFRPSSEAGVAHISIRDERHNTAVDPSGPWAQERIASSASGAGIERLRRRIPSLTATPLRAWAGIDAVTTDHRPIFGGAAGVDGLFLCVGGNFKGFKIAPGVGRCLAELIVAGRAVSADLSPFGLHRFARSAAPPEPPPYALASVA